MQKTTPVLVVGLLSITLCAAALAAELAALDYELKEEVLLPRDKQGGWFQPRPTPIPGHGKNGGPAVVMTIQKAIGSDFFTGLEVMRTDDMGLNWTKPQPVAELGWRDGGDGLTVGVCDFQLGWHAATGKVLGIGHTARYTKKGFAGYGHRRDTTYAVYDPKTDKWRPWRVLEFPKTDNDKYFFNGTHGQWLVEPDGTVLVPVYFVPAKQKFVGIGIVVRCKFDGANLTFIEHGKELKHPVPRGLYEKSITHYKGRYYMTMRNDKKGYVAVSDDGLDFGPIKAWTFDDGTDLGSYNTQQKWVTHSDGLFLVYTRRGANNDHIIRHRAPLFIARVDPEKLHVIRSTERIAVPERGAALGNFDATNIDENETWITVAGGKAYCTRVIWSKPNRAANQLTGN
ncbi:MAG: sialidase family protein [Planctomycetota bacterium]|nr:sialidase family protein [Planctomycetota bacterium]